MKRGVSASHYFYVKRGERRASSRLGLDADFGNGMFIDINSAFFVRQSARCPFTKDKKGSSFVGIRLLRLYLFQVFFCCFVHGFRDLGQSSAAILFSLLLSLAVKTRPSLQIRPTSSQRERETDIYE